MEGSRETKKETFGGFITEFGASFVFFFAYTVSVRAGVPSLAGLIWGGTLALAIFVCGRHNAAHCNPAVTLGMLAAGKISKRTALSFCLAQVLASSAGVVLASLVFTKSFDRSFASQFVVRPPEDISLFSRPFWVLAGLEAVAMFFLVFAVVYGIDGREKSSADWLVVGVAIGAVLGVLAWVFGPETGGSINPARALGPWLVVRPDGGFLVTFGAYVLTGVAGALPGRLFRARKSN